jgi:hypothetical protein
MKRNLIAAAILPAALAVSFSAVAEQAESTIKKFVTDGKASVDFRYRFEGVDQAGFDEDAKASTLRSRLTLASAEINGISFLMEFDDLRSVISDDYNSTTNGNTDYPVVADPEGTDLNQAWARYSTDKFEGTGGRQRINHGNQRFVGGVAWRQNEQTYDSFRFDVKPIEGLSLDYAYTWQVNRIFGPDDGVNPAKWEGDFHFLRGDWKLAENHKLTAYYYLMEIDEQTGYAAGKTVNSSNETVGAEYSGQFGMFTLDAAYASQKDAGDSELSYEADYGKVEAGLKFKPVTLKAGYEVLASDNGVGFQTPLATLHKFQGWADKFLGTPADGIEDAYVSIAGKAGPVKLMAVYHDFSAESASQDYGTEIDLVATWPVTDYFTVQAKAASFDSDSTIADTDKVWLTLQLKL